MDSLKTTDWKYLFLDFDGRIGRRDYWTGAIALMAFSIAFGIVGSLLGAILAPLGLLVMPAGIAALYAGAALAAKRWHDRGKSGWWSLVVLVPFVGALYAIWELGVQPGIDDADASAAGSRLPAST